MKKLVLTIFMLLIATQLLAANSEFLKKANPGTLDVFIMSDNCNIPKSELEAVVYGVVRRSRVKPVRGIAGIGGIDLTYQITCDINESNPKAFLIMSYFGTKISGYGFVATDTILSRFGTESNKIDFLNALKGNVETQIERYLVENFDL